MNRDRYHYRMAENGDSLAVAVENSAPPTPATPSQLGAGEGETNSKSTPDTSNVTPTNPAVFRGQFKAFSKFGDTKSDGKHITLSQSDKWMKQAKVIGKNITTTDTGIYFKKFKAQKISIDDYTKFLEELARNKKADVTDIKYKLSTCGAPGLTGVQTSTKAQSTVDRLTDVSRYTGAHKQRFDETGKGKGIAGRKDISDASGYVHGYQNKDTYSKSH